MIRNFLLITYRNLRRNKLASAIKITSLCVGMICFAVLSLFVYHEFSYDTFHDHPEQILRIVKDFVNEDGSAIPDATSPPALAPALSRELPEIQASTRFIPSWGTKYLVELGDTKRYEQNVIRIDSSFFDVFSFPFVSGSVASTMSNQDFILITESTARRYFNNEDPMGKIITFNFGKEKQNLMVTGVLRDVPANAHFTFDFLISVRTYHYPAMGSDWGWYNYYTYARLKPRVDQLAFEPKLRELFKRHNPESKIRYYTQPITDIHLKSKLKWELGSNGDIVYVRILLTIAIFVIVLAVINYINLVTAQSAKRAKEVGIRKASGAGFSLLVRQFIMESVTISLLATLISITLAQILFPLLQPVFKTSLNFFDSQNLIIVYVIIGVGLFTGFVAGVYPAIFLASFKPAVVLKGSSIKTSSTFLRKGLVTFQFVISTVLIIGTVVISGQIEFMRTKEMGFDRENIIIIPNAGGLSNREVVINELNSIPGVVSAGGADGTLGGMNWTTGISDIKDENSFTLNLLNVDYDFLKVMGVSFAEGRNFSRANGTDSSAVILNEAAIRALGYKSGAGNQISFGKDDNGKEVTSDIVGVIRDFQFTSFQEQIKPFGFFLNTKRLNTIFVKVDSKDVPKTISDIQNVWLKLVSGTPFEFSFQDEQVQKLYANEQSFEKLITYFMIVAIVIACLGLFGLSTYTAQQRAKEIGIRKALGASVMGITGLLSKEFLQLVVLAIILSVPLAWYLMTQWLQGFVYHIEIGVMTFVVSSVAAILIATLTVSFQSIKVANANPIDALRSE